jgi:hypothetical protein
MTQQVTVVKFPKLAKEVITRPIPETLIKQKPGKGGNHYITGQTVIDHLNEAFGYLWSFEALEQWVEKSEPKFNPKYDKEPQPQGPVAHVRGRLTVMIPQPDGTLFPLMKEQYGSKTVIGAQSDQESIFKAAGTDAMKKCASLFGIGLELYRDEDEQAFFDEINYEDPWTDEAQEEHKESLAYIKEFMRINELDAEGLAPYLDQFSEGQFDDFAFIVPENIEAFVSYLDALTGE